MSQENQVTTSMPVDNLPVKRKRGRPRKDESLRRVRKPAVETPKPNLVQRSTCGNTNPISNGDDALLGQVFSGFLEGSFDAGYFIKVKVGETDTFLRGVVFDPRLPQVNTVPSVDQLSGAAPLPSSQTQSSTPLALKGVGFDINQIPQASPLREAEPKTMSSAHVPSGGQENDAGQGVQLPSQVTNQNSVGTGVLQSAGIFSSRVAAIEGRDETMTRHKAGPVVETSQGNETNSKVTEAPQQIVPLVSEPNQISGASKVLVDLNDTPVDGAADFLASETIGDLTMKHRASEANHNSGPSGTPCVTLKVVPELSTTAEANPTQSTCKISISGSQSVTFELVPELAKTAEENPTQSTCKISIKVETSFLNGGPS